MRHAAQAFILLGMLATLLRVGAKRTPNADRWLTLATVACMLVAVICLSW
jgi:multisubunit Na+/H+ antiporter MnhF subunit